MVDVDDDNRINYSEFVTLFTSDLDNWTLTWRKLKTYIIAVLTKNNNCKYLITLHITHYVCDTKDKSLMHSIYYKYIYFILHKYMNIYNFFHCSTYNT